MAISEAPNRNKYPPVTEQEAARLGIDADEWKRIIDGMGREPSEWEARFFSILWSERCSNKSASVMLETVFRDGHHVIRNPGRLGIVDIGHGEGIVVRLDYFSERAGVEPFYNAEAAIGSAHQELVAVGAKPLAFMNMLRVGQVEQSKNHLLLKQSVAGLAGYANRSGVPMVNGDLVFHPRYNDAFMLNTCSVGYISTADLELPPTPPPSSPVVYAGEPIGHVRMRHVQKSDDEEISKRVQVSDSVTNTILLDVISTAIKKKLIVDVECIGPGGVGHALASLAVRLESGIRCDLDRIPCSVQKPKIEDVLLCENLDRLLFVPAEGKHREVADMLTEASIDSGQIASLVDNDDVTLIWRHNVIAAIPYKFAADQNVERTYQLVKFPPMLKHKEVEAPKNQGSDSGKEKSQRKLKKSLSDIWVDLLAHANLCSRHRVVEKFDQGVGSHTVVRNGGDAAVINFNREFSADGSPRRAIALSIDSCARYGQRDPYLAAVQSVAEGMRNVAATGAFPIAVAQSLNYGSPAKHKEISEFSEAVRGVSDSCRVWDIPILRDAISLNTGSAKSSNPVLGTPAIVMIGMLSDASKALQSQFKDQSDLIFLLGQTRNEIGCSEYVQYMFKTTDGVLPDIDFTKEKRTVELLCELAHEGLLQSAHDVAAGGLAIALAECALGREKPIGFSLDFDEHLLDKKIEPDSLMFGETSGRFVVTLKPENEDKVREICKEFDIPITASGRVGGKNMVVRGFVDCSVPVKTAHKIWQGGLDYIMRVA